MKETDARFARVPIDMIPAFGTLAGLKVFLSVAARSAGTGSATMTYEEIEETTGLSRSGTKKGVRDLVDSEMMVVIRTKCGTTYKIGIGQEVAEWSETGAKDTSVTIKGHERDHSKDTSVTIEGSIPYSFRSFKDQEDQTHSCATREKQESDLTEFGSVGAQPHLDFAGRNPVCEDPLDLNVAAPDASESKTEEDAAHPVARAPKTPQKRNESVGDQVEILHRLWVGAWKKQGRKLRGGKSAREDIRKGLKQHGFEDCRLAIVGHSLSEHHQEGNYVAPAYAFRAANVEKFMAAATDYFVAAKNADRPPMREIVDWIHELQADLDHETFVLADLQEGEGEWEGLPMVEGWADIRGIMVPVWDHPAITRGASLVKHAEVMIAEAPTRYHQEAAQIRRDNYLVRWYDQRPRWERILRDYEESDQYPELTQEAF